MKQRLPKTHFALSIIVGFTMSVGIHGPVAAQSVSDEALEARVEEALAGASDLPADSITVEVREGVVTLSGSVICEECGGSQTPGGVATIQQSLGAVVRAVPGVERVVFALRHQLPGDG